MARVKNDTAKFRKVQFAVDGGTVRDVREIKDDDRDPSLNQAFRRAAAVTAFFDKMKRDGYEVTVMIGDKIVEKRFLP